MFLQNYEFLILGIKFTSKKCSGDNNDDKEMDAQIISGFFLL